MLKAVKDFLSDGLESRTMQELADAASYFNFLSRTIGGLPFETINQVADALVRAYEDGQMVYTFGNGGSAALASHLECACLRTAPFAMLPPFGFLGKLPGVAALNESPRPGPRW